MTQTQISKVLSNPLLPMQARELIRHILERIETLERKAGTP